LRRPDFGIGESATIRIGCVSDGRYGYLLSALVCHHLLYTQYYTEHTFDVNGNGVG
jgi:hypothetical protein